MWCIGVEVEQETSAPPPKKNPGSAPAKVSVLERVDCILSLLSYWLKLIIVKIASFYSAHILSTGALQC